MTEPRPSQRGHMPPVRLKLALLVMVLSPRSTVIPPLPWTEATLKEYAPGEPMCGCASRLKRMRSIASASVAVPTVERGLDAHPLLVDDDRGRQPVEHVDLGPRQRRHEALHERAVGLVDQPLRLRGDRAEHQRALARAGDAGEHRQPALRDLDADVLEVVHARAVHADQVVAVGGVRRCGACRARSASAQRSSWMRIRLPAGSRKAQSRTPYGCSVGSWTTSASPACSRSNVPSRSVVARMMLRVGALGHHLGDGAALVVGDAGVGGRRVQHDGRAGLVGGADRDPAHPAVADVVADLEAEGVAVEGQRGLRVVVREEGRVNGDVHGGHARCGSRAGASRFLIGLVTCLATHGGMPAVAPAASRR